MRDSDSTSNNSNADDEGSSDGTQFEWDADATLMQPGPSGVGAGSARTDRRRNPAVRELFFDTDSEEDDDDEGGQMEVVDVHNAPLSPVNQPTDEPSDNEEEPPVSPNLISAEDHEMANLEMEAVENERDFILETLSRHVEPEEAVHRAFLSVQRAQELSGTDIANAAENRYRVMSNFYHGDPDATYDNNLNPWDEVHLLINERKLNYLFVR